MHWFVFFYIEKFNGLLIFCYFFEYFDSASTVKSLELLLLYELPKVNGLKFLFSVLRWYHCSQKCTEKVAEKIFYLS